MSTYRTYRCDCGHEVSSPSQPASIRWSDGHVCRFGASIEEVAEACLMNDEASTDDELLQYFTKTLGLLEHDAAKLIARRTEFLNHLPKGVKP